MDELLPTSHPEFEIRNPGCRINANPFKSNKYILITNDGPAKKSPKPKIEAVMVRVKPESISLFPPVSRLSPYVWAEWVVEKGEIHSLRFRMTIIHFWDFLRIHHQWRRCKKYSFLLSVSVLVSVSKIVFWKKNKETIRNNKIMILLSTASGGHCLIFFDTDTDGDTDTD